MNLSHNKMIKSIIKYLLKTVGVLIFIYILSIVDFSRMGTIITDINIFFLGLSIILALILVLIKTQRWQYINRFQNINPPFFITVKVSTIASALGMVTPGRLGELIKVKSIRNYSPNLVNSWNGVLIDRLHDIIVMLIAGLVSTFFIAQIELKTIYLYAFPIIIIVLLFFYFYKHWKFCLLWIVKKILPEDIYLSFRKKYEELLDVFLKTFSRSFLRSFGYSVIGYLVQCLIPLMLVYSFGAIVPIYVIFIIVSVSAFATLIPITIGGFGTREGVYIYLLGEYGIPVETALAVAFINGVLIFTLLIGVLAFAFWAANRFSIEF